MPVRAKFRCHNIERPASSGPANKIQLHPVYAGSEENKKFFQLTPSGEITLWTVNESAAAQFQVGQDYYVDFTPAEGSAGVPPASADVSSAPVHTTTE